MGNKKSSLRNTTRNSGDGEAAAVVEDKNVATDADENLPDDGFKAIGDPNGNLTVTINDVEEAPAVYSMHPKGLPYNVPSKDTLFAYEAQPPKVQAHKTTFDVVGPDEHERLINGAHPGEKRISKSDKHAHDPHSGHSIHDHYDMQTFHAKVPEDMGANMAKPKVSHGKQPAAKPRPPKIPPPNEPPHNPPPPPPPPPENDGRPKLSHKPQPPKPKASKTKFDIHDEGERLIRTSKFHNPENDKTRRMSSHYSIHDVIHTQTLEAKRRVGKEENTAKVPPEKRLSAKPPPPRTTQPPPPHKQPPQPVMADIPPKAPIEPDTTTKARRPMFRSPMYPKGTFQCATPPQGGQTCEMDDRTMQKLEELNAPALCIPKGCYFKPQWDNSPPVSNSKPKLRKVPPLSTDESGAYDVNCNAQPYFDSCALIFTAQLEQPSIDLSQFQPKLLFKTSKNVEGSSRLDKQKTQMGVAPTGDANGNVDTFQEGEKDVNGNIQGQGQLSENPAIPTLQLKLPAKDSASPQPRPPVRAIGGAISSATTANSRSGVQVQQTKDNRAVNSSKDKRSNRSGSEVTGSEQTIMLHSPIGNSTPPSSEYYVTSVPASRQSSRHVPSSAKSDVSSTTVKVLPRLIQSHEPGGTKPGSSQPSTGGPYKGKPRRMLAAVGEEGQPQQPIVQEIVQNTVEPPVNTIQDIPNPEQNIIVQNFPEPEIAAPSEPPVPTPSVSESQAKSSSGSSSSSSSKKSSSAASSNESNNKKESTEKKKSSSNSSKEKSEKDKQSKTASEKNEEKSALVPSKKGSGSSKGADPCCDPCAGLPGMNYAYCPPRSNAFVAPHIKLRDIDKKYTANICSSEFAKEIEGDGSLNFGFSPRADYATQVTFSVEPKKSPVWKTMLRCGFVPIINAGVPPCYLSQNLQQYETDDSYDSYDSEYDSDDYSSSSSDDKRRSKESGSTSGSKGTGSSGSGHGNSGSKSGSKSSGSSNQKRQASVSEEPCETCDTDTVTVRAGGQTEPSSVSSDSGGQPDQAKTIEVINI